MLEHRSDWCRNGLPWLLAQSSCLDRFLGALCGLLSVEEQKRPVTKATPHGNPDARGENAQSNHFHTRGPVRGNAGLAVRVTTRGFQACQHLEIQQATSLQNMLELAHVTCG